MSAAYFKSCLKFSPLALACSWGVFLLLFVSRADSFVGGHRPWRDLGRTPKVLEPWGVWVPLPVGTRLASAWWA